MRTFIILVFGLFLTGVVQAQVGSSISADGTAPNDNAMLDVQSPATGAGKGILIPRVTLAQRTTANASLAGGLLDGSGNLRGGGAQGLIVYQTDGSQGLYFNTSQSTTPTWIYLGNSTTNYLPLTGGTMSGALNMGAQIVTNATYYGDGRGVTNIPTTAITESDPRWASASNAIVADIATRLVSNVWAAAGSTTNYLPRTGGTMSGALNMGAQIVTNVSYIDFNGSDVSVGREANGYSSGAAVGWSANGYSVGAAMGERSKGTNYGAAVGSQAEGSSFGAAMGEQANGYWSGAAVGWSANGNDRGAALGREANGYYYGTALGRLAKGTNIGVAVGNLANGSDYGAALGREANGYNVGAAVGCYANGKNNGVAVGYDAKGTNYGIGVGYQANGSSTGVAVGVSANGTIYGAAVGYLADGYWYGAAMGLSANGSQNGVAVGGGADGNNGGVAVGRNANGSVSGAAVGNTANGSDIGTAMGNGANGYNYGAAVGWNASGARTNVAIGVYANAHGSSNGTERIAIGHNVTNQLDNTARIRGHLYLDGGTGMWYRATFGDGNWTAKAFEIDHPLDPENKVLRHFCMEGPQVWNVYAGNAQLVNGLAVVQLPDYYSALNLVGSEIYGLTPLGDAFVWIVNKVSNNHFVIAGKQDIEVSWTIKVLRNDPGCLEDLRRRPVEQLKNEIR